MRYLLYPVLLFLLFVSCKKTDDTRHYTIVASKPDTAVAVMQVADNTYTFSESQLERDFDRASDDVVSVDLSSGTLTPIKLELYEEGSLVDMVTGSQHIYMVISSSGISKGQGSASGYVSGGSSGGSNGSSGGSTTGSGCPTVQCSGTTQSGCVVKE